MSESITVRLPKALKERITAVLIRQSFKEGRRISLSDFAREVLEKSINDLESDASSEAVSRTVKSKDKTDQRDKAPA